MAKPYEEITKTDFKNLYNVDKVSNDISEIMNNLKTFNPNTQAVAFAIKKKHSMTLRDVVITLEVIVERLGQIEKRLDQIETRLSNVEDILTRNKIDGILERNNLH